MTQTTPDTSTSLIALRCERCGGTFDFRALGAIAVCPYCQHQQELPSDLLAQVARYESDIELEQKRARFHSLVAKRYGALEPLERFADCVYYVIMFLLIGGLSFGYLGFSGGVTVTGAFLALGLVAIFATSAALTARRNRSAREGAATSFESACPNCRANNVLEIGQTLAACAYCGAALVPGERVSAVGLSLAEALTRASKLDAVATERTFRLRAASRQRKTGTIGAVASPLFPGMIAVYSYQQYRLGEEDLAQLLAAAGFTLLFLAAPIATQFYRRVVESPIRESLGAIASAPGSTRLSGIEGTISWLNSYWWGELGEYYDIWPGTGFHAVATSNRGFPVLVAVRRQKFLHIAVAADLQVPKVSHELISKFGFQVRVCESGVLATLRGKALTAFGDPARDQRLRRCIDAVVEAVISEGGRPTPRC